MRILLTEVTGELGRALVRSLLAAGHDVVGIAEQPHRDLDPEVSLVRAGLHHPVLYELAADADVVVQLPAAGPQVGSLTVRPAEAVRVADAAARAGARLVFPSLSLLVPSPWQQAEQLVAGGWAPNLVIRLAPPLGRQVDALVARTVAAMLDRRMSAPVRVLHIDDLIRFLVVAVRSERTGVVDLGTADLLDVVSARRILNGVDPRPRPHGTIPWPELAPDCDVSALRHDWDFECGWSAADAAEDTARGLSGRRLTPAGAVEVPGRVPMPAQPVPACDGRRSVGAGPEGEFDDHADPRFPVFCAAPVAGPSAPPLTPMSLDVHVGGLHLAARALSPLLGLRGAVAREWDSRLVAVFGHRIYLGASVLAAAEPRLPERAAALARRLSTPARPGLDLLPQGPPRMGSAGPAAGLALRARITTAARSFRRQVEEYRHAAAQERLDPRALSSLHDAALQNRIRLLRSRIHQGWVLGGLGVLLAEVAPGHLDCPDAHAGQAVGLIGRVRAELSSVASVLRAHPYAKMVLDGGDVEAARVAAPMFARSFDAAIATLGHLGPNEYDLSATVFADHPQNVLAAAERAVHLRADEPPEPAVGGAAGCRELAYDCTIRFTHQLRSAVRELGRRLAAEDRLGCADDIVYLTVDEALVVPADVRLRVKRRRSERERLQHVRPPAVVDGAWLPGPEPNPAGTAEQLRGAGLGDGVAEGTVRVVLGVDDVVAGPGDVIVLPACDIDCALLMGAPGAVIGDCGAVPADAVALATQIGVPVVVNVPEAGDRLVNGMRVRVDGRSGTVTVLAAQEQPALELVARVEA